MSDQNDLGWRVGQFGAWFRTNAPALSDKPSDQVAEAIGDRVLRIDKGLGVEVGEPGQESREVIITAFSEPNLFRLVHQIVTSVANVPGWLFVPLKPPRGFSFNITLSGHKVDAKLFEFQPLNEIRNALRLIPPRSVLKNLPAENDLEELAWLIVETGIGEELTGAIQHVEIGSLTPECESAPVDELARYVGTHWIH